MKNFFHTKYSDHAFSSPLLPYSTHLPNFMSFLFLKINTKEKLINKTKKLAYIHKHTNRNHNMHTDDQ